MSIAPLSASVSVPGQGSTGALTPNAGAARTQDAKNKKLREACEGFESIFIQKMWEQMQNTVPKEGLMHSREERTWQSMYDQELSKKMTSAGGIGLADMMYEQLSRNLQHVSSTTAGGNAPDTRAFSAQAAPLLPPAPQTTQAAQTTQTADPIYEAAALPERGDVDQGQVNAVLQSLRAEQAARPAPVNDGATLDTVDALLRHAPSPDAQNGAPLAAASAQTQAQTQAAAQPVVTRSTFSSNIPNSTHTETLRAAQMQAAGAPFQAPPLTAANAAQLNNAQAALNAPLSMNGQAQAGNTAALNAQAAMASGQMLAGNTAAMQASAQTGLTGVNAATAGNTAAAQPRVTRTRHTTNIPSRVSGRNGRTSGNAPLQNPSAARSSRAAQAGAGDIRTLNLQGESMNLTSSAAQNLLARQIVEQQQAQSAPAAPSPAMQAGLHSAGLGSASPEALQAAMAGRLGQQMNAAGGQNAALGVTPPANMPADTAAPSAQEQADAVNMQVTALRHDNMLQQMQGMSPAAGAAIPPLRSR